MIKVAALTSSLNDPSARFRIRQYVQPLKEYNIRVAEYIPDIDKNQFIPSWAKRFVPQYKKPIRGMMLGAKLISRTPGYIGSWTDQITWLNRELIPGRCILEPLLKKPLVFDVDDAIWLASASNKSAQRSYGERVSKAVATIAQNSTIVMAGNNYLANWFSEYCQNIKIIPTAIDTERFIPHTKEQSSDFIIGWTGSAGNLGYLRQIESPLKQLMERFGDVKLLVMADKPPSFSSLPSQRVKYIPWSSTMEVEAVQQMDVGLMPLPDNEWTKGKCSFKMLQYMACQVPVVVSPVGMNTDILEMGQVGIGAVKESDWYDALVMLYQNHQIASKYGIEGRMIVEQHFSQRIISKRIAEIFQKLV